MTVEGMYFDELSKIRVLQPEVLTQTEELKEECKQFVDSTLNSTSLHVNRLACITYILRTEITQCSHKHNSI